MVRYVLCTYMLFAGKSAVSKPEGRSSSPVTAKEEVTNQASQQTAERKKSFGRFLELIVRNLTFPYVTYDGYPAQIPFARSTAPHPLFPVQHEREEREP